MGRQLLDHSMSLMAGIITSDDLINSEIRLSAFGGRISADPPRGIAASPFPP
jgi:hypothetical protein